MDDERKVGGRSFQARGPETAKLRDPYGIVLVLGTIRSPRAAERRQRRPVLVLRAFSGFGAISRLPMGIFRILGNLEMGQGRFPDSETAQPVSGS